MDTRSSTRGSLLVAEDNATNQALVRAILKAAGYEVSVVGNGIEAIEAHMTGKFDAILMDCLSTEFKSPVLRRLLEPPTSAELLP